MIVVLTFTLGSSRCSELSTLQKISPTTREPRLTTVEGRVATVPCQECPGRASQVIFTVCPMARAADLGLVHEGANLQLRKIGLLQEQVSGIDPGAGARRKEVDGAVKGSADVAVAEDLLGEFDVDFGVGDLRLRARLLLRRVADLRLKLGEVGLGAVETIAGGSDFVRGGGAALLKAFEGGELALRRVDARWWPFARSALRRSTCCRVPPAIRLSYLSCAALRRVCAVARSLRARVSSSTSEQLAGLYADRLP